MRHQFHRNAGAIVTHADFQRQGHRGQRTSRAQAHPRPIGRSELNFAVQTVRPNRFGCIFDQIEQNLHQLITIAINRRQRRIINLYNADMTGKTGQSQPFDMVKNGMNVEAFPLQQALVGEGFHSVHQLDDAVGLVTNQAGEGKVLTVEARLQQLCRTADARKRIFNFMRQHGGKRGN